MRGRRAMPAGDPHQPPGVLNPLRCPCLTFVNETTTGLLKFIQQYFPGISFDASTTDSILRTTRLKTLSCVFPFEAL